MAAPRPSYFSHGEDPHDALCRHFNVFPPRLTDTSVPATLSLRVLRDEGLPTHVLAAIPADSPSNPTAPAPPKLIPIDASLYEAIFQIDLGFPSPPVGFTGPVAQLVGDALQVTLPVLSVTVPDPVTLPLLLLFALGFETEPNLLAWRMLPSQVIQEFPNAAAMALILARARSDQFDRIYRFNQGLWKNILGLGLRDTKLVELVQTAWNVTAESRRIRVKAAQNRQ
ncbi:hypothetical protein MD484_g724, partial [Candolleomyces efflorescens]